MLLVVVSTRVTFVGPNIVGTVVTVHDLDNATITHSEGTYFTCNLILNLVKLFV